VPGAQVVAQEAPSALAVQEGEVKVAQSHVAWAAVWPPTES